MLTSADIPGENECGGWWKEELLATASHFAGQPVAVVVADTERRARFAAAKVACAYAADADDGAGLDGRPILTVADARARNSYFFEKDGTTEAMKRHWTRGDAAAGLAAAPRRVAGTCRAKSQKHFYMEPHTAWCVPGGESCSGRALVGPRLENGRLRQRAPIGQVAGLQQFIYGQTA